MDANNDGNLTTSPGKGVAWEYVKRKKPKHNADPQAMKEEARRAAAHTASQVSMGKTILSDLCALQEDTNTSPVKEKRRWSSSSNKKNGGPILLESDGSVSSVQSSSSLSSTTRAELRGRRRGLREDNENSPNSPELAVEESSVDLDLTTNFTVEDTTTTGTSKSKRSRKRKKLFPRASIVKLRLRRPKRPVGSSGSWILMSKKKQNRVGVDKAIGSAETVATITKKKTRDAWMCGYCGLAFSSLYAAEKHERKCVTDAFVDRRFAIAFSPKVGQSNFYSISSPTSIDTAHSATSKGQHQSQISSPAMLSQGGTMNSVGTPAKERLPSIEETPSQVQSPVHGVSSKSQQEEDLLEKTREAAHSASNNGYRRQNSSASVDAVVVPSAPSVSSANTLNEPGAIHLDNSMRKCIMMTDEAVCKVIKRAHPLVLTHFEADSERELALLARDRSYYDTCACRAAERHGSLRERIRNTPRGMVANISHKLAEAYELIKEGDAKEDGGDTRSAAKSGDKRMKDLEHDEKTLYVNVMVKNSVKVVNNELERLAKLRWDTMQASGDVHQTEFERFRAMAHRHVVKLASLALESDFTPRRIAGQLSRDLYRLMEPQMKLRGVSIETEIEYRVGPFFVLAVNVLAIDWILLMEHTHKDVTRNKRRWSEQQERKKSEERRSSIVKNGSPAPEEEDEKKLGRVQQLKQNISAVLMLSKFDILQHCLALLYNVHWIISVPLCTFWYHVILRSTMRKYIITSVTDDIFRYVEKKGMEMELNVQEARHQAAFIHAALRELREDERTKKQRKEESEKATLDKGVILGPLLGPAIKEDNQDATIPSGFVVPENLEFVGLEINLPVGFRRLRWAFLSSESHFMRDAVFAAEAKYENITMGEWDHHSKEIGLPKLPDGVNESDFIGAVTENSYLMPKSAFVKANMCYEKAELIAYNDYCFCVKKAARTPDVPYGSTFIAHTQILVTDNGGNSCQMVCSVEAEFPNGPPMVARQIKSGMRAGTAELFVLIGETVCKYADEYP